ncbi:Uncharacterised protein [Vibrio cholerae]|nr:Uncharacterised protein [Vibrio cholerae]
MWQPCPVVNRSWPPYRLRLVYPMWFRLTVVVSVLILCLLMKVLAVWIRNL